MSSRGSLQGRPRAFCAKINYKLVKRTCQQVSSLYLDVKQWLKASRTIRGLLTDVAKKDDIVAEHDSAALNYLSDHICCLHGRLEIY